MSDNTVIVWIVLGIVALMIIGLVVFTSVQFTKPKKDKDKDSKTKTKEESKGTEETKEEKQESSQVTHIEIKEIQRPKVHQTPVYEPPSLTDIVGEEGEDTVDQILKEVQEINGGEVYKNLILTDDYNNHTEIDNLYVSEFGIFIIETKSWTGEVRGTRFGREWRLIDPNSWSERTCENPFFQNDRHVNFFNRIIHISCEITPVVTFISDSVDSIECKDVVLSDDLKNYLLQFDEYVLEDYDYDYVVGKLNHFKNHPPMTHEQYKNTVKKRYTNKSNY